MKYLTCYGTCVQISRYHSKFSVPLRWILKEDDTVPDFLA
uniref:Uncharacterized protein n=1 Tax=Nelumbo nucifera TaxID=4432 RepID=A0A822Z584_NELNU|nr:TPA_asm: hypothetical protein HUJ06_014046 [Nelumbo nucifera]